MLDHLSERISGKTIPVEAIAGRVVTLKLRTSDFRIRTRRRSLPVATQTARTLFGVGRELLSAEATGAAFRLIGIGISELVESAGAGGDFFSGDESRALNSEKAVDALRNRFGASAVVSARTLKH